MIIVKAPNRYINEPDILSKSGEWIVAIGKEALLITGSKALEAVKSTLLPSLASAGVSYTLQFYNGTVTRDEIEGLSQQAENGKFDVIIGIGGGKVLDISKAVGDKTGLPVVTVPTIAATCAAWSALTVLYDEQGRSTGYLPLKQSPVLALADTRLLAAAPKRYLASGIGDTIVKWYETIVNVKEDPHSIDVRIGTNTAKLALEILQQHGPIAYQEADHGEVTPSFIETTNAILLLAGLVGSLSGQSSRAGIAHAIHSSLTHFPETQNTLHGEKVAFGLLAQVVLEGKSDQEIQELGELLHVFGLPITLQQLGITEDAASVAKRIAKGVILPEPAVSQLAFEVNEATLAHAIERTDQLGRAITQKVLV
ncbi:iron-containing alcohol dehydrogenase family protein [Paenibacillus sp. N3.4]|uniref:iron-containing alcohol dehydrogenase family protein n=1 Tax=Paenibacillus sp. N3.4 TaxID=2603222 RepID=UPI0011C815E0|nr:iron-containing alcohol dehydrogenase family protein [Paenibacillus sp. N3.4]TXK73506.1 iron-containing alcohol dehydrogenase family protein [Paenibacillus sp. N3.4]